MRRRTIQEEEKVADLTPMLDVVFIMLIFFIVTATFIKETGVEVNRPDTKTAEMKKAVSLLVGVGSDRVFGLIKRKSILETFDLRWNGCTQRIQKADW